MIDGGGACPDMCQWQKELTRLSELSEGGKKKTPTTVTYLGAIEVKDASLVNRRQMDGLGNLSSGAIILPFDTHTFAHACTRRHACRHSFLLTHVSSQRRHIKKVQY